MDLLTELRDDTRADRLQALWEKHGKWVIYAAISIVVITAVLVYSKHHREQVAMAATGQYMEATRALIAGNHEEALKLLNTLEAPEHSELYSLVLLKKAQVLALSGKKDEATRINQQLAERSDVYGDIAKLETGAKLDDKTLTPLAPLRREYAAWNLLEAGKKADALAAFKALMADEGISTSQRDRAQTMVQYLEAK